MSPSLSFLAGLDPKRIVEKVLKRRKKDKNDKEDEKKDF